MFEKIVSAIGAFSYRNRKTISIIAAILLAIVAVVQSQLIIEYSYAEESLVTDIFPQDDTVVIVYENKDEDKIQEVISYLEKDEHVTSIQAYANTLGAEMSAEEMSGMMGSHINTKSQLIEEAILTYFNLVNFTLQEQNKITKKEEKKDEN